MMHLVKSRKLLVIITVILLLTKISANINSASAIDDDYLDDIGMEKSLFISTGVGLDSEFNSQNDILIAGYTRAPLPFRETLPGMNVPAYVCTQTEIKTVAITPDAFNKTHNGLDDVLIIKIDNNGNLAYGTYFGGCYSERAYGLTIDSHDNLIVTGFTASDDFPISPDAIQQKLNGNSDIFLAKFNDKNSLIWSTYFGGNESESAKAVALDTDDNIIIVGSSGSSDFPLKNPIDDFYSEGRWSSDPIISKFSNDGNLLWSTFFGGSSMDIALDVQTDSQNNIIVSGITKSEDFLTTQAYDKVQDGISSGFLAKFTPEGELVWSTFWATFMDGSYRDAIGSLAIDNNDDIIISGYTNSPDFPNTGAYDTQLNRDSDDLPNMDSFISKFSSKGELIWSTFIGGSKDDIGTSIDVDSKNNIILTGNTYSENYPSIGDFDSLPFNQNNEDDGSTPSDIFVTKFNSNGKPGWSISYGGESYDYGTNVVLDNNDNIFILGHTDSIKFNLKGPQEQFPIDLASRYAMDTILVSYIIDPAMNIVEFQNPPETDIPFWKDKLNQLFALIVTIVISFKIFRKYRPKVKEPILTMKRD